MPQTQITESRFRRLLVQAVVVPIGIMALVAAVAFWLISDLLTANRWLEHSYQVIVKAHQTESLILNMQTAARGYFLTSKPRYLQPYQDASVRVDNALQDIRLLLQDSPAQQARVTKLENLYVEWDQQLRTVMAAQGQSATQPLPFSDTDDRILMGQMRGELAALIQTEEQLLGQRSAAAVHATEAVLSSGVLLLVLAGGLIGWVTYRHLLSLARRYGGVLGSTEQRAAALRENQERLAGIISSAMDAIISVNQQQEIILFNSAAERMFGYQGAEVLGKPLSRLIPARFRPQHAHDVERFGQTGVTSRAMGALGKLTALRADGEEFPIEAAISQVRSGGEKIFTVILRDITERKRAEESIQRINQTLQALIAASPLPVIALDMQRNVTIWNPAAEQLYGWTQAEVLGQPLPHVPAHLRATSEVIFARSLHGESMTNLELIRRTKDGRLLNISMATAPLRDAAGRIYGMIGISTDVTRRKREELELQQAKDAAEAASHAKDQFLAVLSHELRTPLTPVLSTVAALEGSPEISEELRADLSLVRRNVELEARLIDDMLDLTRISKGKLRLHFEVVDVHASLRNSLLICRSDMELKQLHVDLHLSATRQHVRADPARLQQVFWNLIKNAVKFTPNGGRLVIATGDDPNGQVRIEVRDTGIGISSEALPRIFNAFEQGEQSITRQFGGLGLGLAITRMLVEVHHGHISAQSGGKGQGATFTVVFPTVEPAALQARDAAVPPPAAPRRDLHLLLVEDHEDTVRVMAKLLTAMGYRVTTAGTVAAAIAEAARQKFDLIISDIGLPDGTGLELMRQIRARDAVVPGIALSGYGMEADVHNSREAGFVEHLTKPVDLRMLDAVIQQITVRSPGEAADAAPPLA